MKSVRKMCSHRICSRSSDPARSAGSRSPHNLVCSPFVRRTDVHTYTYGYTVYSEHNIIIMRLSFFEYSFGARHTPWPRTSRSYRIRARMCALLRSRRICRKGKKIQGIPPVYGRNANYYHYYYYCSKCARILQRIPLAAVYITRNRSRFKCPKK